MTDIPLSFLPIQPSQVGYHGYNGLRTGQQEVLKAGHRAVGWDNLPGRPLTSDILVEYDVKFVVRDGTTLYADIYRPATTSEKIPALLMWSPFGKTYNAHHFLPHVTWKACVKADEISGLEKFEALDPAVWCPEGYAIVNIDTRGAGDSEGDIEIMGTRDAQDGYDVIELLAKMPFCNGSVGMAGNSHLAISQYFIAAQQPPSLKAIAPWEGCGDLYREQFCRGGIFYMSNFDMIIQWILRGKGGVEDFRKMFEKYPLMNDYWKDKRPNMTRIKIPSLISGSDHSGLHTMGTVRAWLEIDSPHKWLRWSAHQEWHDLWSVPENHNELLRFFDRFLKGKDNGFETSIPKVRMSVLQYGDQEPLQNVEYSDYPLPETHYESLYLGTEGRLLSETPKTSEVVQYTSTDPLARASFVHTFEEDTRLIGLSKLHVFMSCRDHDDMCVYVRLRKLDVDGNEMANIPFPKDRWESKSIKDIKAEDKTGFLLNLGPVGQLRASHRAIDASKSIHPQYPFHPHDKEEKITPGDVVELDIGIWQASIQFRAGESIRLDVFGINEPFPELSSLSEGKKTPDYSVGTHTVHFGDEYPSRLVLPLIR